MHKYPMITCALGFFDNIVFPPFSDKKGLALSAAPFLFYTVPGSETSVPGDLRINSWTRMPPE